MATTTELKTQLRDIAEKSRTTVNNTRLSSAEKLKALDGFETEAKGLLDEIHLQEQRDRIGGGAIGDIGARATSGVIDNKSLIDAPAFTISADQAAELYDAAQSFQHKSIDMKATATTDAPMSQIPDYKLPPLAYRREPLRIIDLMPVSPTERGEVDYFRITTPAAAASVVAEGGLKPASSLVYEKVTAPVRKIAQTLTVNDETLMDYGAFLGVVSEELLAGMAQEENRALLLGVGVAPDLTGLLNTANVLTQAKAADTALDAVLKAITAIRNGTSYAEADGIILHPTDFQTLFLSKDDQHRYLATDPVTGNPNLLWGLTVKTTTQITQGTALVGAFKDGVQVFLRMAPRIEVNPWSETEFKHNQTLIRCEERLALAVTRPTCLCKVTGL